MWSLNYAMQLDYRILFVILIRLRRNYAEVVVA